MTYNTNVVTVRGKSRAKLLSEAGLNDTTYEEFSTSTGRFVTPALYNAKIADGSYAVVPTEGASAISIMPLIGNLTHTSGSTKCRFDVHGLCSIDMPGKQQDQIAPGVEVVNPVMVSRLTVLTHSPNASASGSSTTFTTNGIEFKVYDNFGAAIGEEQHWSYMLNYGNGNTPDTTKDNIMVADHLNMGIFQAISAFDAIGVEFTKGSADTAVGNAVYWLHYTS